MTRASQCTSLLCLFSCLLLAACSSSGSRVPNAGVELSHVEGISLIRLDQPKAEGHGRFELINDKHYELEAHSLDAVSLIELIVPNYRVSVRCKMPVGRYDFFCDTSKFPSENPVMQRYTIQQATLKELDRAFRVDIKMDVARRTVTVTD